MKLIAILEGFGEKMQILGSFLDFDFRFCTFGVWTLWRQKGVSQPARSLCQEEASVHHINLAASEAVLPKICSSILSSPCGHLTVMNRQGVSHPR